MEIGDVSSFYVILDLTHVLIVLANFIRLRCTISSFINNFFQFKNSSKMIIRT